MNRPELVCFNIDCRAKIVLIIGLFLKQFFEKSYLIKIRLQGADFQVACF